MIQIHTSEEVRQVAASMRKVARDYGYMWPSYTVQMESTASVFDRIADRIDREEHYNGV